VAYSPILVLGILYSPIFNYTQYRKLIIQLNFILNTFLVVLSSGEAKRMVNDPGTYQQALY